MEQLLDAILELIRLVLAQILDPRPIMAEFRRLHRAFDHGIVDAVEFEREEQQMRRCGGQPLGNVAVKLRNRGIDAVAGMNQAGIGSKAAGEIVDRLVAPDRFGQPPTAVLPCGKFRELALVVRLKRDAFCIHPLQVAGDFRRVDPGIEIGQIPFRQLGWSRFGGCLAVRPGCPGAGCRRSGRHGYFQIWRGRIRQELRAAVPNGRSISSLSTSRGSTSVINRVPNRTAQQHDPCDKRPPPRTDGRLRVQRDQGEAPMLEQELTRPILEDVSARRSATRTTRRPDRVAGPADRTADRLFRSCRLPIPGRHPTPGRSSAQPEGYRVPPRSTLQRSIPARRSAHSFFCSEKQPVQIRLIVQQKMLGELGGSRPN